MIEKLKHFPVNWMDGMKINKSHFISIQNFVSDSMRDCLGIYTSLNDYGLLPIADSLKTTFIIDNHKLLKITVERCQAITPNGSRIDISTSEKNILTPYPVATYEIKDDENIVLMACLSVSHFNRIPCGEPDPDENPPRYPYTQPKYSLDLIPENDIKSTLGFGTGYLTVGRILIKGEESRIDNDYIPPCISVSSHRKLKGFHAEIDRFYSQIEIYASQIMQKIRIKKQANLLALMVDMMADKTLYYLGLEINRFRCTAPHTPPVNMLLSVIALARILKNFIDAYAGAGKEELLNYFAEWCNINQGDFEAIFSGVVNTDYNHNQINITIVKIEKFMKILEELYVILNRLDYIGKKRDGSIFISENTDSKDAVVHAKRSQTFLAD